MESMCKISLIIPVYNAQAYLTECLESIVKQELENYEIICIDDGSTDRSTMICESYAAQYPDYFRVFHQKNLGVSAARNKGAGMAEGTYIMFLDSDDYLEPGVLKQLWEVLCSGNENGTTEILEYGYRKENGENREERLPPVCPIDTDSSHYLKEVLKRDETYEWYAWKYVILKKFWKKNQFYFWEGHKYEDVKLMPRVLLSAARIRSFPRAAVHYRLSRPGAITCGFHFDTETDKLHAVSSNIRYFCKTVKDPLVKDGLCNNLSCLYYSTLIGINSIEELRKRKALKQLLKEDIWICRYTTCRPQLYCKYLLRLFGVEITAYLLHWRKKLKEIQRKKRRWKNHEI